MRNLDGIGRIGVVLLVMILVLGGAGLAVAQPSEGPQHENPDEADDDSDLQELERWFGGRMGEIHADCTEGITVGNYDACEDLDSEYESYLERYVTVERETTSNESERDAETFNQTRNDQQELAERLQAFNETRQEYEAAREAGDDDRARARAREMRRQANRINELSENVSGGLRALDDDSSANLTRSAEQIEGTAAGVNDTATEAESASLEPVELAVDSDDEASYASPATVSGLVRTGDWSAVTDGVVVVEDAAGFQANTSLNEDGRWSVSYRPTAIETGETTLSVRYVPRNTSRYMGVNETTALSVAETPTTLEVEDATTQAAYGENVTATGTLTAGGEQPENVTVNISVQDEVVGTTRTDSEGRFEVTGPLPAAAPAGNATLGVHGGAPGTALAPSNESQPLSVSATATSISAQVDYDDDRAHVSGRLETADGEPVARQTVRLEADGSSRLATTDANGAYSITVDRPASRQEAVVGYPSNGGNLNGSQTDVTIEPRSDDSFAGFGDLSESLGMPTVGQTLQSLWASHPILMTFLGVLFLLNAAFWVYAAWRRFGGGADEAEAGGDGVAEVDPPASAVADETGGLAAARAQLEQAPSTAVQLAFATVRSALGMADSRTHWEVYQAASESLDEDRRAALRTITETFEAATFSPGGVDSERASDAVDDAERCLSTTDGGERRDE
ncbi:hypothetical protein HWV07_06765 [Natronomonas salina]|uniref:DUF4129 domain-containing protein n=1 Tax=Natronomonas salina TaxID=1710540 RepID=UPI0015B5B8FE|nr:DUF4129 domain-containing protein [Natronomonas salina]QLD88752.1 hypothetical protein HWV07_06765 [Natronomonas salina]